MLPPTHTHTSSSSVDGSKVRPCEVSQGSHANSDMLTFPGSGSDKVKIEINFLKGFNLIKTTKPEQDLGFFPPPRLTHNGHVAV